MADIPGGARDPPEASREAAPFTPFSPGYSPTPSTRILGEESDTDSGFILVGEGQSPPGRRKPGAGKNLSILSKPSDIAEEDYEDIDLNTAFNYMRDDQNVTSEHESSEATDDDEEDSEATASIEVVASAKLGAGTSRATSRGASQSKKPSKGGRGRKPSYTVRRGHPQDALFPTASGIPPKKSLTRPSGKSELISDMRNSLIMPEPRNRSSTGDVLLPSDLSLSAPQHEDRAIDHKKGMCIYWKMPKCGFKLPLSDFEVDLLGCLDVAPAQVASTSWCAIASFQSLFEEFKELKSFEPTVNLFSFFFQASISNYDFVSFKARSVPGESRRIFAQSTALSRIHAWNEGWVYLRRPEKVLSLQDMRVEWRPLTINNKAQTIRLSQELSEKDEKAAKIIKTLVQCQFLLVSRTLHIFLPLFLSPPLFFLHDYD